MTGSGWDIKFTQPDIGTGTTKWYIYVGSPTFVLWLCDLSSSAICVMDTAPVDTAALAAEMRRAFESLEDRIDEAHAVFCDVLLALEKLSSISPPEKQGTT